MFRIYLQVLLAVQDQCRRNARSWEDYLGRARQSVRATWTKKAEKYLSSLTKRLGKVCGVVEMRKDYSSISCHALLYYYLDCGAPANGQARLC